MLGVRGVDRLPVAMMQNGAVTVSPLSVLTVQRLVLLSKTADRMRVLSWMSRLQIEAVGDVIDVAQDLRLRAVALGPLPFLLQLVGERVRVLQAFDVAAAARIAVPEPGAADAAAGLEGAHLQAELAQAVDGVEAADARADDDGVELGGFGLSLPAYRLFC